jgi:4-hydroxy-4-methyl-2-oxoglutarate aldolase
MPTTIQQVSAELLAFLRGTSTCEVSNAIEALNLRMRNEGYIQSGIKSIFPAMAPVAGYAVTGRIRTTAPPIKGLCYYQNPEWWEYVASAPDPKIIVIADVDPAPGVGAYFGEVHTRISQGLGCVAYVTNGTVRDLPAIEAAGFPCFAGGVSVSHSYAHLVEIGAPVEIGSLKIEHGDLLHGDLHGVQKIPLEAVNDLPRLVDEIRAHERQLIHLCEQPDFSIDKLIAALRTRER